MIAFYAILWLLGGVLCSYQPGQRVQDLRVSTLDGEFMVDTHSGSTTLPLLLAAYDARDASSRYMWRDSGSVENFVKAIPDEVHCLFLSYSEDAKADAIWMKASLQAALDILTLGQNDRQRFWQHMHFATNSVAETGRWLPGLLGEWISPRKVAVVSSIQRHNWTMTTGRLDSDYGWLPWPDELAPAPLTLLPDPCQLTHSQTDTQTMPGHIALALLPDTWSGGDNCSLAQIVRNAQDKKAVAVVIAAAKGHDVTLINCKGEECNWPLSIPASMIGHDAGQQIQAQMLGNVTSPSADQAGQRLQLAFQEQQVPGHYAGIDEYGQLIELGWSKWPTLMHLAWQGQWQRYLHQLQANLSRPALEVPIFVNQNLSGPGLNADIELPPIQLLQSHDTFELDFKLSCPGSRDKDCPVWDHTVQLFVCCDDPSGQAPPCEPCGPTVWSEPYQSDCEASSNLADGDSLGNRNRSKAVYSSSSRCGRELGRWITPFRRRIGRWLTDVTPLLPLLTGRHCHFHLQTAPWALTWTPSLTLRFSNISTSSSPTAALRHTSSSSAAPWPHTSSSPNGQATNSALKARSTDIVDALVAKPSHAVAAVDEATFTFSDSIQPAFDNSESDSSHVQQSPTSAAVSDTKLSESAAQRNHELIMQQDGATALSSAGLIQEQDHALRRQLQTQHAGSISITLAAKPSDAGKRPDDIVSDYSSMQPGDHVTKLQIATSDQPIDEATLPMINQDQTAQRHLSVPATKLKPHKIVPLFDGGDFDANYNSKYQPVHFASPEGLQRAVLEAVITGHGYDNNQCAEFCITSHHFIVNGKEYVLNFTEAGKPWGCADKVCILVA